MTDQNETARAVQRLAFLAGAVVAALGGIRFAGWMLGTIDRIPLAVITMKTNASLCLLLAGAALALVASSERPSGYRRITARSFAGVVLVLGALTLAEHVTRLDLGIDQLLAKEPPGAAAVTSPNRMGPPASLSFTLLGTAILLLTRRERSDRLRTAHQLLAGATGALALLPTLAYLYGADELYGIARYTGIAWSTAVALLALSIGVLAARPRVGTMALVTSPDPGGAIIRRLLVAMVLLPIGLGWLRVEGERAGWFDAAMGTTLIMVIFVLALSSLAILAGRWASESHAAAQQSERVTRERLDEIERIYDSARTGLAVFDPQLRYCRINEWLAAINGLPPAAHIGKTIAEVVPDLAPAAERIRDQILRTGEGVIDVEMSGATGAQPGELRSWVEQWMPLKDDAGQVVGINVVVHEITDRKRAEESLRREMAERLRTQDALRDSEARFRDLANAMPQLVWTARPDGTVDYTNDRVAEFTGLVQQPGERLTWEAILHPEDLERSVAAWRSALATGEVYEVEHRLARADGSWRWHLSRGVPVRDATGRIDRWYGTATDIHEFKEAEAAVREQDRQKTAFLAVLSHELRNPLAPISNAVHILEHAAPGSDHARRAREVLARQVHQLARLVDDLLDVTRISSGKIQLRRERVDIAALAGTVADDLRPVFAARGVRLEVALRQSGPLFVNGDRTRLAQVISNLLANAAKFSPAESAVTISVECSEGEAVLQVVDAGLGIHPDLLPHVFEPFVQADRTLERSDGGLGLGLALVKSIVDLHGGSVAAASDGPGTGASFVVRLELAAEQSERAVLGRTGAPSGAGRSVLVVEDNRDAASSLKELLELAGHRVEVAHDGGAAVLAARTSHPDVVLCDVGLPVKDGYQVAREIRSDPGLCGTFLVALTGYAFEEDLERARQSGFDDHLRKPPDIEALQRIIRRSPETIRS